MSTLERQRSTTNGQSATTPRLEYPEVAYDYEAEKGEGWRVFAAIMLGFAGILGLIDGIVAVSKSSFYVAGAHFVFSDLHTWGWIIMAVGAIATLSAFGVMNRRSVGTLVRHRSRRHAGDRTATDDSGISVLVVVRLRDRRVGHLRTRDLRGFAHPQGSVSSRSSAGGRPA